MTPLGSGPGAGAPSASTPLPKVHVPPELQVHVVPEQLQSPEQLPTAGVPLLPPHAVNARAPTTRAVNVPTNKDDGESDRMRELLGKR